jgi:hypothetical protein
MRICLGFSEVANFINTYRKGFESNGHTTYTVISRRNKFYPNAQYDVVLDECAKIDTQMPKLLKQIFRSILTRYHSYKTFIIALFTCDIFIYNTGGNIVPYKMDYKLIKMFNKKLVVIFLGSEIRHWYVYRLEMERLGYAELFESGIEAYRTQNFGTYQEKLERVRSAEKYSDLILSHPSFAQLQRKPYMRGYIGLELDKYRYNVPLNSIPLIVHAPTNRGVKGTQYVINAIDKLKSKGYKLNFKLVEDMSNDELLDLLSEADIVIDELNSDSVGVLSTEAMATGNCVLTSYLVEHFDKESGCPILNTNRDNLYTNLEMLITDTNRRSLLARQGRIYVEKYNNLPLITENIIHMLSIPLESRSYDVIPDTNIEIKVPKEIKRK